MSIANAHDLAANYFYNQLKSPGGRISWFRMPEVTAYLREGGVGENRRPIGLWAVKNADGSIKEETIFI